jgi:hypothetical protein
MHPHDTDPHWRRRWRELESEWSKLDHPITETMSAVAINAANHRLQSFYIQAYHLKDALRSVAPDIESTISADPAFALLADLANRCETSRREALGWLRRLWSGSGRPPVGGGVEAAMARPSARLGVASPPWESWPSTSTSPARLHRPPQATARTGLGEAAPQRRGRHALPARARREGRTWVA